MGSVAFELAGVNIRPEIVCMNVYNF